MFNLKSNMSGNGDNIVVIKSLKGFSVKRGRFTDTGTNIGLIYADLLIEVLCRLPPKILIQCCCVCKGWYKLIFGYCVPRRITPSLPVLGVDVRIIIDGNVVVVRALIPPDQPEADDETTNIDAWPPESSINYSLRAEDFLGSCNGLMLFRNMSTDRKFYILWNPTRKRFTRRIPYKRGVFAALAAEYDSYKIIIFPKLGATPFLHVYSSSTTNWSRQKVRYNNHLVDNDAATDLVRTCVYLHGRLFRLSGAHFLLWYILEDDVDDVICDGVKLPDAYCLMGNKKTGLGCIGSCQGHLQYAQSNTILGLMKIWVFDINTSEWILKHSVDLQALVDHPQLVDHRNTFPEVLLQAKLKPLAFGPVSDAVIIWGRNCIFSYYCNSCKLVPLQIPDYISNELIYIPANAFPFTPRLVPSRVKYRTKLKRQVLESMSH